MTMLRTQHILSLALTLAFSGFASAQAPVAAAGTQAPPLNVPTGAASARPAGTASAPQAQAPNGPGGQLVTPQVPPLPAGVVAAAAAPTVPTTIGAGMSPDEFAAMLNSQLPLNPGQTRQVNKAYDDLKRARAARVGPAPRAVSVSARITLDAGASPHVLRLSTDAVTSVVFSDVTGAPWKVTRVVSGMKDALEITLMDKPGDQSNMFTIAPRDDYVSTNLAVFLEGAPAPVMMAVETNQANVDYRVDLSVQARGPNATMPAISRGLAESVSPELISMVSGVTPNQAKPLKVIASDVPDVEAWVLGNRMFVRTKANILTPAVPKDGKVATGPDGMKVYELPLSPEVRLMSDGSVGRLQLGGFPPPSLLTLGSAK
jgi:intracellular multiplication protein IcmK